MATKKEITAQYIDFIAEEVINKFGGSYQNKQNFGKSWRQEMPYRLEIERFIIDRTKIFLRLLDVCDSGNINTMYKVCYNISEHVSKYLVKKSSDLTRKEVTDQVLQNIFLRSNFFISKFKKSYKRPIDMSNERFVVTNPGVIAMYKSIQMIQLAKFQQPTK